MDGFVGCLVVGRVVFVFDDGIVVVSWVFDEKCVDGGYVLVE